MTIRHIHRSNGKGSPFRRILWLLISLICVGNAHAQFAPVVGFPGTTAIHWDSSAFVSWATGCNIQRGLRCVAVPDSGYASIGDSSAAIGPATQHGVVSLGDGGIATLTFARPIVNGDGFDFAVFENGFFAGSPVLAFLELAFVEVSSDGQHFVRFPATDNIQDTVQNSSNPIDGSYLNNLAGKYTYGYGTPFDLDELKDSAGLDVNNITHVRIIDVVGSIDPQYGSYDSRGRIVNDPYPTNYPSSGFDLDAVGVINQKNAAGIGQLADGIVNVYPNPFNDFIHVQTDQSGVGNLEITEISGQIVAQQTFQQNISLHLNELPGGIYAVRVVTAQSTFSKLIVKE